MSNTGNLNSINFMGAPCFLNGEDVTHLKGIIIIDDPVSLSQSKRIELKKQVMPWFEKNYFKKN